MKFITCIEKIEDVKKFVNLASKCEAEVFVGQDCFTVSGKSIMGLFSLDLSKNIIVSYKDDTLYQLMKENGLEVGEKV